VQSAFRRGIIVAPKWNPRERMHMAKKKKKVSSRTGSAKRSTAKPSKKPAPAKKPAEKKSSKPRQAAPPKLEHGDWAWHELMTPNVESAKKFYAQLFGWKFAEMPMPGFTYTIVKQGGKDHGGMMTMAGPDWQNVPPHWMVYVRVADVDRSAAKAAELGGTICVPPTDIPVGRFAVLTDPQGATFSIYNSNQ
jgi:predicted enzyme related to lactoylglutathione lyase